MVLMRVPEPSWWHVPQSSFVLVLPRITMTAGRSAVSMALGDWWRKMAQSKAVFPQNAALLSRTLFVFLKENQGSKEPSGHSYLW